MRRLWFICIAFVSCISVTDRDHVDLSSDAEDGPKPADGYQPGHHKFLWPLNVWDGVGFVLAALGLMIAASGGIGGGGILVPLYLIVFEFDAKHAIPLSNITIFGGAIANTILNAQKIHPTRKIGPCIDWDLMLVMEPLTVAGAVVGVFINKVVPQLVLTTLLSMLLFLMGQKTLKKGMDMWGKETIRLAQAAESRPDWLTTRVQDEGGKESPGTSLVEISRPEELTPASTRGAERTGDGQEDEDPVDDEEQRRQSLDRIRLRESRTQWPKVAALSVCCCGVLVLTILKGGSEFRPLGLRCGTWSYWGMTLLVIPWVFVFAVVFRRWLLREFRAKRDLGYVCDDVIQWDEKNTIKWPLICSLSGLVAGLFGVGGGIVKGPLMLAMGIDAQVASATAATMILFTASSACISFVTFGDLVWDYGALFFVLGFVATYVGQVAVSAFMQRRSRQSPIVFAIGSVVVLSAACVLLASIILACKKGWAFVMTSHGLCGKDD